MTYSDWKMFPMVKIVSFHLLYEKANFVIMEESMAGLKKLLQKTKCNRDLKVQF